MNFPRIITPLNRLASELLVYLALIALIILLSCKEKEIFDVKGDPQTKFFFNEQRGVSRNDFSYDVLITPIGQVRKKFKAGWPVHRTCKESVEAKVTATIDNSLVELYNAGHKTVYKAFPEGTLVIENTATLASGENVSTDSIKISLSESNLNLLTDSLYLAPVKLVSTTLWEIASNLNVVYMRLSVFNTNCVLNPNVVDMKGQQVADRSAWEATCTFTTQDIAGDLASMFDGDASTGWRYISKGSAHIPLPFDLSVNMKKKVANIGGIRIKGDKDLEYFGPLSAKVFTSDDGTHWTSQGKAFIDKFSFLDRDGTAIKFYGSVSAQYIKITVTSTANNFFFYLFEWDTFAIVQ